ATFASECRTASQAIGHINNGFNLYNITTPQLAAALLSTMLLESGNFSYNINHWTNGVLQPTPGVGTRAMLSFPNIWTYAQSLPETSNATLKLLPNDVRDLVLDDEHSFASAVWYLSESGMVGCGRNATDAINSGGCNGFRTYVEDCLVTEYTQEREALWMKTVKVL
ncbi:hypothetical protein BT69DRAFT_1183617, partial [Atractiella rhizophila]